MKILEVGSQNMLSRKSWTFEKCVGTGKSREIKEFGQKLDIGKIQGYKVFLGNKQSGAAGHWKIQEYRGIKVNREIQEKMRWETFEGYR